MSPELSRSVLVCRAAFAGFSALAVSVACSGQLISTAELEDWLARRETNIRTLQLELHHEQFWGVGGPTPPKELSIKSIVFITDWTVLFHGEKYRHEKVFTDFQEGGKDMIGVRVVYAWNGTTAKQLSNRPQRRPGDKHNVTIANEPIPSHYEEDWLWWLGLRIPWADEAWSFHDILQADDLTGPHAVDGELQMWRATAPPYEDVECRLFARRVGGFIQLARVEATYTLPGGAPFTELRMDYSYNGEAVQQGVNEPFFLADHAVITKAVFKKADPGDHWGAATTTLKSASRHDAGDDFFDLAVPADASVWDDRYKIGYKLGTDIINFDGRLFRTRRKLEGDVGSTLEDWLADATIIEGRRIPSGPNSENAGNGINGDNVIGRAMKGQRWPWLMASVVLFCVALFLVSRGLRRSGTTNR